MSPPNVPPCIQRFAPIRSVHHGSKNPIGGSIGRILAGGSGSDGSGPITGAGGVGGVTTTPSFPDGAGGSPPGVTMITVLALLVGGGRVGGVVGSTTTSLITVVCSIILSGTEISSGLRSSANQ